jgi:tetratricopeptide (TPR) repeat protein
LPEEAQEQVGRQLTEVESLLDLEDRDDRELAEAFGELGKLYYLYGFSGVTQIAWENAALLAPNDYRWHYYLGVLGRIEGEMEAAEQRLLRVLELRPEDRGALLLLAQVDLDRGRLRSAAERFEGVLAADPNSSAALYGLGQIAVSEKRYEEAVLLLERALEGQPEGSVMNHQLGLAYRGLGDMAKAVEYMGKSRSVDVRSHNPLMAQLVPMVRGAHFRARLGVEALKVGEWGRAVARLEEARALDPDSAWIRYNLAVAYRLDGRIDAARQEFGSCLVLDPDYSRAHFNLGTLLADVGDYRGAAGHFSRAREIDPQDHEAALELAVALSRLDRQQEAIDELHSLVQRAPQYADARLALATLLAQVGRAEESRAVIEEMMQMDATVEELAAASVIAARLAVPVDPAAAETYYRHALELVPASEEALFGLAILLGRGQRFDEASREFDTLVATYPERPDYRIGQAMALLLGEEYPRALQALEAARRRFPGDFAISQSLARLLATCPDDSVRDGARALELAREVMQEQQTLEHAETLAMALAEVGDFEGAVELQRQIVAQRQQLPGETPAVERSRRLLEIYMAGGKARAPWKEGG